VACSSSFLGESKEWRHCTFSGCRRRGARKEKESEGNLQAATTACAELAGTSQAAGAWSPPPPLRCSLPLLTTTLAPGVETTRQRPTGMSISATTWVARIFQVTRTMQGVMIWTEDSQAMERVRGREVHNHRKAAAWECQCEGTGSGLGKCSPLAKSSD
jgi:hypothetical protein